MKVVVQEKCSRSVQWLDDKKYCILKVTQLPCVQRWVEWQIIGQIFQYFTLEVLQRSQTLAKWITGWALLNFPAINTKICERKQVCSNATHTLLSPKNWLRVRNSKNAIAHAESSFLSLRLLCSSLGNCTLFCVECIYQYTGSQCVRCIQTQHNAHVIMTSVSETSHENGQLIPAGSRPWTGVPTMNVLWIRGLLKITLVSLKCL